MYQSKYFELKSLFEAKALYEAIETQLEGMAVESQERDRLLVLRSRLEDLISEYQENTRGGSCVK